MTAVVDLYAAGLAGEELRVRDTDGGCEAVPVARWLGPLMAADVHALQRVEGPVLDVGCGPGRHVLALARQGVLAIGVDASPAAVRVARDRGAAVVQASIFGALPGAGTWGSALLLDGNIGIGGDPVALLRRLAAVLRPGGRVLAELAPPGTPTGARQIRLEGPLGTSEWFAWASVGADDIDAVATVAGFRVAELWEEQGRWFAAIDAR